MTSTPKNPHLDDTDLAELRTEIDELKAIPEEEMLNPLPRGVEETEPEAEPTNAIGTEKWDEPVEDESLDQD